MNVEPTLFIIKEITVVAKLPTAVPIYRVFSPMWQKRKQPSRTDTF